MRPSIVLAALLALVPLAGEARVPRWGAPQEKVEECVNDAAEAFGIEPIVLWTLLDVESGTVGRTSRNTNGTEDIGPMQINTIHLPHLAQYGIDYSTLRDNLCININVGAYIFTREYAQTKNVAMAIARYHSRTPRHQQRYLGLAIAALDRRIAQSSR